MLLACFKTLGRIMGRKWPICTLKSALACGKTVLYNPPHVFNYEESIIPWNNCEK
jgi:hypothetical protein